MEEKTPKEVEAEGSKAFSNGLKLKDNPYDPGEQENLQWEQGWKLASEKRKDYFRHVEEHETLDQMESLDRVIHKLTPKRLRQYSSSIFTWIAIGGVVALIGWAYGFKVVVALAAFSVFVYACIAVFVLVQHFAGKYGDQLWKKVLGYAIGGIIGLLVILILWQLMAFVLEKLELLFWCPA